MLLLDDADDEDDDGFIDELDEIRKRNLKKMNDAMRKASTYETVLLTLNTRTVPSEQVDANLLPNGLHSMSDTGDECSFSSHN